MIGLNLTKVLETNKKLKDFEAMPLLRWHRGDMCSFYFYDEFFLYYFLNKKRTQLSRGHEINSFFSYFQNKKRTQLSRGHEIKSFFFYFQNNLGK